MIGLHITELKDFTDKLFKEEIFDNFLVTEAEFVTGFRTSINGRKTGHEDDTHVYSAANINGANIIPADKQSSADEFVTWRTIRPLAFQLIKGKQLPKSFQIVLKLSSENTIKTVASMGLPYTAKDVSGLFLNIRYEDKKILCVSGCSMTTFTMDKSVEKEWDGFICRFLRHHKIAVEEV